jgi:hypothetical protein
VDHLVQEQKDIGENIDVLKYLRIRKLSIELEELWIRRYRPMKVNMLSITMK